MKTFKWILASLLVTISLSVSAQQKEKDPEKMAEKRTEKMAEQLELTPEQKEKVLQINLETAKKMDLINNDKLTQEERRSKMRTLREDNKAAVEAILTEDQKTKWQQHKGDRKPKRNHR